VESPGERPKVWRSFAPFFSEIVLDRRKATVEQASPQQGNTPLNLMQRLRGHDRWPQPLIHSTSLNPQVLL
jgi:hypothetical protein